MCHGDLMYHAWCSGLELTCVKTLILNGYIMSMRDGDFDP